MIEAIEQIARCLRIIKLAPKDNEFFYLEDNANSAIIDGKMIKMMPPEYEKYNKYDEFYVHIDIDNKTINFVVYNIADFITNSHKDKELGTLDWSKMLIPIATFFIANLQLLCTAIDTINRGVSTDAETRYGSKNPTGHPYQPPKQYDNSYEIAYKERNEIRERFEALLKDNKTGAAIEFISASISKMCDDKKFQSLDFLMLALPDAMNIPAIIAVLKATAGADHLLKDRKAVFEKAMKKLNNNKATKMVEIINALAPGKEYAGIKKYSNDTNTKTN